VRFLHMTSPFLVGSSVPPFRTLVVRLTVAAFFSVPVSAAAQAWTPQISADSIFSAMDTEVTPGCALSVIQNGLPIYEQGYGMANLEYGIPITPRSIFHVASVSKHFTAMAIELLVNGGEVSWDDEIRTYVPEVPDFGAPITLRHLVHHVSGIRDQWNLLSRSGWRWESDVVTQGDVLDITSRQTALNFPSGSRYLYSNTGFTLLAVVVERVSGQTLRKFTTERMFEPLGMNDTHFHDDHNMIVPNRAWAYEPDDDGKFGLRNSIPDFDVVGATSLFTTVHDLAAWDRNFDTGRVGGRSALDRLHELFVLTSGENTTYAHGLSIGTYRGLQTVGHGGADAGYRSHFLRFPSEGISIAVLCNFPSSDPGGLARRVANVYLADHLADPEAPSQARATTPLSRREMEALIGIYHTEINDRMREVNLEGDDLMLIDQNRRSALRHLGNDQFESSEFGGLVTIRPPMGFQPGTLEFPPEIDPDSYERHDPWSPTRTDLQEFVGSYHSDELDTEYQLSVEDGQLAIHHRKLASATLTPMFGDAFRTSDNSWQRYSLIIMRNSRGRVDGFQISDGRVWRIRFWRAD
jgi:CubicO group peptidase (beta-lactamase class C family)